MTIRLNEDQARAAERLEGPVLVTAGAGSGKTRMLTERFANAVIPGRLAGWDALDPGSVVAITYTEKAAGEIAERVRAEIARGGVGSSASRDDLWISTIHGFCTRILRRYPFEASIDPLFSVASTLTAGRLRERAFMEALTRLDDEGGRLRGLLDAYREDAVFEATLEIVRQLAVAGLEPPDLRVEPAPTVTELLLEAERLFGDGVSVCDIDYTGSSTTHIEHSELCRELLGDCSSIATLDHSERGTLERVLEVAERYVPIRSLKGFEDLKAEMVSRKVLLMAHVATALTAEYQTTLVELAGTYAEVYEQLKHSAGVLDFDDLQTKAVRLLESRPEIAARYADRFKVVMIDEFQDTDALQLRLVERVAGGNLCTVGDEMQAIYGFRGADVEVYRRHKATMASRGALSAELAVNYRSHPRIIEFVNSVFGHGQYDRNHALPLRTVPDGREPQYLDGVLGPGPRVEVLLVDAGDAGMPKARVREATEIADRLADLMGKGVAPGDVAVLLRAYSDAHIYADALACRGIPAAIVGGDRFFGLPETAVMRALTRVVANAADEAALGVLLVSEFVSVTDDALLKLRLVSEARHERLWDLIRSGHESLDAADTEALRRLRAVVESARARIGREPLEMVLLRAVEEAGYDLRLLKRGNMGRDAFANVLKFARRAAEFERGDGSGPAGFSAYLDDKERLRDLEAPDRATADGSGAVRLMSVHASKGLEFPVVVVPDIGRKGRNNDRIVRVERASSELRVALKTPKWDDDTTALPNSVWFSEFDVAARLAEDQERERVFYVALTRARDLLLVSGSGALNPKKPPVARDDLVRLVRVLGYELPIGEPRDQDVTFEGGATCRLRVVKLDERDAAGEASDSESDDTLPLPFGDPLGGPGARAWLPKAVSYTQLSEFERCPRQFRIRRVLGIAPPGIAASGRPSPNGWERPCTWRCGWCPRKAPHLTRRA